MKSAAKTAIPADKLAAYERLVATVRGVKGAPAARHTWKVKLFG